ncbi:MAG: FHA domain-containing protein [Eubacteriales bacterium]|nr:FHA domain-containing protein [Eubacteriales bacterium]
MNLTRCSNGHFYDMEKFQNCPHCSHRQNISQENVSAAFGDKIMPKDGAAEEDGILEVANIDWSKKDASVINAGSDQVDDDLQNPDGEKTIGIFMLNHDKKENINPVTGWLVCVRGEEFGKSYPLKSGRNFIGRDCSMDVVIGGDKAISRKCHAVILYDPKSRMFLVQPGTSRELFYLNDKVVLGGEPIGAYEILTVGNTELMLIPCCGEKFTWEEQRRKSEK